MVTSPVDSPGLPMPHLTQLSPGILRLKPLSRKGRGPGLIVLVPDASAASKEEDLRRDGVLSPLMKWAEEGYSVVQIGSIAFDKEPNPIQKALKALSDLDECEPQGIVGLVACDPQLWNMVASKLGAFPEIVGTVLFGDASTSLMPTSVPTLQHLAGKVVRSDRSENCTFHEYPNSSSFLFATPFQEAFHSGNESLSHTRSLTYLKSRMGSPYFDLSAIWDEHCYFEFGERALEKTMATMVQEPYVNNIPTLTGGTGRASLTDFYRDHFIFNNPEGMELELVSRTIGIDRVIDEFIAKFDHTCEINWMLPGIPPTGRKVEVPVTSVVNIRGDRLYHEHISWDQTTVLIQLGLLPEYLPYPYDIPGRKRGEGKRFEYRVPGAGRETAQKLRDKNSVPSNEMLKGGIREASM